jgi:GT2 family glycosyltransferase
VTFPESDNEPRQRGEDGDQFETADYEVGHVEVGHVEADVTDINPVASDIPTEWFFDDDESEDIPVRLTRPHFVTAVLVSHQGAVWLPAVLTTLARSHRTPEVVVAVDTNSTDDSAEILRESLGSDRVISLDSNPGFGAAVSAALERTARPDFTVDSRPLDTIEWIWLLHDDSAPDTRCLEFLLETADDHPSAAILGPKILGWHDRRLLLEVGVAITSDGRRVTGLERREHDQGQHDGTRDVLAVSSAGMLIRRDVWDALGGFDPALPLFRDDLDFCWRAHRMGERVVIAPDAVLHHREASAHGRRDPSENATTQLLAQDREAAVHVLLSHSSGIKAFFLGIRLFIGSAVRSIVYALGKDLDAAKGEVLAVLRVLRRPGRIKASRTLIAQTATEPASVVNHLRPSTFDQVRGALEAVTGLATTSNTTTASLSALDSGPVDDDAAYLDQSSSGMLARVIRKPSVIVVAVLTLLAIISTRALWLGDGVIQGGALLPSPWGASDLWGFYIQSWHNVGPGSTADAPPYLAVVALLGTIFLGKATWAVQVLVLLAIPLAGWAAYFASRGMITSKAIRAWGAITYALVPAVTGAVAQGRIGTAVVAVVLPFAVRSVYRTGQPGATLRRAAGSALLLAIVLAFAPAIWLIGVVAIAGALVLSRETLRANYRQLLIAVFGSFFALMPWSFGLILQPVRFFLEPGLDLASLTDPNLSMLDVILLNPGGPGMSPIVVTAGILLAALLALLRTDRRKVVILWWAFAGIASVFALLQVIFLVTPPGQTLPTRTWPGPATLVISLALIAATALGAQGLRTRFVGQSFSLGQPAAVIAVLGALLAPVLSALWLVPANNLALFRGSPSTVPAFVAADATSPQAPRTLMLNDAKSGRVTYTLINGDGLSMGDADVPPPAQTWVDIDPYVAAMASGRGGDEVKVLAGYGVRYVVLAPGSARELIPTLDSEPGLRRLSNADGETLWRVAGVTSRARIFDGVSESPVGIAQPQMVSTDPYIDQTLPDGTGERVLFLGASADSRWTAAGLEQVTTDSYLNWSATFSIPQGSPQARVEFDSTARNLQLLVQLGIVVTLIVVALPSRKRIDLDADAEALAALEARNP